MKLTLINGVWVEQDSPDAIYLERKLKHKCDLIKKRIASKWDCVFLIDGQERSGKSTLGLTIGTYLTNGKFNASHICAGVSDASQKIKDIPPSTPDNISVLMIDEGSLVFNSKDAMKTAQKDLMKVMDVVGVKNIVFIIILPSIFDLNKSIAVRRSRFLLHVYTSPSGQRGRFLYFNYKRKPQLYFEGKKNYGRYVVQSNFKGSFVDYKPSWYAEYLKVKEKSLLEALNTASGSSKDSPENIEDKLLLSFTKNNPEITQEALAKAFGVSKRTIQRRLARIRAKDSDKATHSYYLTQDIKEKNNNLGSEEDLDDDLEDEGDEEE